MGFAFQKIKNLPVSEKELNARFHHFLEDKVLIIVANIVDVCI